MANNERLGASFSIDTTDLKAGLAEANRLIRASESEFREAAAGMDDWTKSEEGLTKRQQTLNTQIDLQKKKIAALAQEKQNIIEKMTAEGKSQEEIDRAIDGVNSQISKESKQLDRLRQELDKNDKSLEKVRDGTEETGKSLEGLKAAGGVAVGAIAAVGAACVAAVGAFLGLAESTREARNNMAKLETGFTQAGHSAEDAANTYNELYGILGDDGQATEAAAHLAQLTTSQEELAQWTNIATGVYATFGDSLPIEGLTEAANETAKTGALTGGLADALNWAGVNEDEFQASLDACSTEQERQALITETLNGLYSDSAAAYRENNAEVIAAQEAQANLNSAINELGAIAEPIMTTLKTLAADLLTSITPFVSLMGEGLAGALSGAEGAADSLAEGINGLISTALQKVVEIAPFLIDTVLAIFPTLLSNILAQLPNILQTVLTMVNQVVQSLSLMLPTLIPVIIDTVIMLVETLLDNLDMIIDAGISLIMGLADGLISAIPNLLEKIPVIIEKLLLAISDNLPKLLEMGVELLLELAMGLIDALPQLISQIPIIIEKLLAAITSNLPKLLKMGIELTLKLAMGLIQAAPQLISQIPLLIEKLLTAITSNLPLILKMGIELTLELAAGLIKAIPQLVSQIPQIIKSIVNALKNGLSSVKNVGGDLIRGLWNGISDMAGWIKSKIQGFGQTVLNSLKDFFGIRSPSRLMADVVGKNLALGIGEGFEDNIAGVNKDIAAAMNFTDPTYPTGKPNGGSGGGLTVYQTNNFKQAETSQLEKYKAKQQLYAAARLIKAGAI